MLGSYCWIFEFCHYYMIQSWPKRDKITKLLLLYVTKRKKECSSGIIPEHTELDYLLQEIYERQKESEANYHQQSSEKANQINKEKEAAEDMRTKSLQRLSETRKKEAQDSALSCSSHNEKRRRSSGGDALLTCGKSHRRIFSCEKLS